MNWIKKNPTLVFGLTVTILFLLLAFIRIDFFDTLGLKLYDTWMKLKVQTEATDRVVIIEIDDESIENLGRWPWPRSMIAACIDKIATEKPAVIGLNIIYSEAEENAGLLEIDRLEDIFKSSFPDDPKAPPFLNAVSDARENLDRDSKLAKSMKNAGNVILPVFFKDTLLPEEDETGKNTVIASQAINVSHAPSGLLMHPQSGDVTLPIAAFQKAADGMGHINYAPDQDGTFRRERPFYQFNDLFIPSYSLVIAANYLDISPSEISVNIGDKIYLKDITIPLTSSSEILINFIGSDEAFKHYSFFDVINNKIPLRLFKGKIVLLSFSAKGLANPLSTPVSAGTSFGDFSGNIIWSILNRSFIREMPLGGISELIAILFLGLLITWGFPRMKALIAGTTFFFFFCLLIGGSAYFFLMQNIWIQVIYPLLLLIVGYTGIVTINYFVTEAGKEKVEGESAQTNRMLGISFQSQGMLDMAFDKFRKVPVDDEMKDVLYNLALDYERKRQFNKAAAVYGYIEQHDNKFKDVTQKKEKLNLASETMVFGSDFVGSGGDDMAGTAGVRPTLGRYEIMKQLGKGAMGTVYLGQDPRINRTTAIKTVKFSEDFDEDEAKEMKTKFFREAESAGTLSHPHIVTIYDAGEEQDLAYIAMEYLEGEDLDKYTKKKNLLPMRRVIDYIADIAEGLDYAHQKGIVHRDIKPANVMLIKGNKIKITDFGIARITASSQTKTGIIKGTPYYMSPEQITGKKVDGRSDIFSLGTMMFQLLTGEVPFKGSSPAELMHKILNEPHPNPQQINPKIFKPLVAILNKAMAKKVEQRYPSAGLMAQHLRTLGQKIDAARSKKQQSNK